MILLLSRSTGEWQSVRVEGPGPRISLTVNDTMAGEWSIDRFGGFVMFDNRAEAIAQPTGPSPVGRPRSSPECSHQPLELLAHHLPAAQVGF